MKIRLHSFEHTTYTSIDCAKISTSYFLWLRNNESKCEIYEVPGYLCCIRDSKLELNMCAGICVLLVSLSPLQFLHFSIAILPLMQAVLTLPVSPDAWRYPNLN